VATELAEIARGMPAAVDPQEARDRLVHGLRRAKRRSMVEVAVADLAGTIGTRDATRILSDLADEVLEQATRFELGGDSRGLAMIAVSKLGGRGSAASIWTCSSSTIQQPQCPTSIRPSTSCGARHTSSG
jgi:glutamine synthetase adenylyltransferase